MEKEIDLVDFGKNEDIDDLESRDIIEEESPKKSNRFFSRSVVVVLLLNVCERFSFNGIASVLQLYIIRKLLFSDSDATTIISLFFIWAYICPIPWAIIADSFWGRRKVIMVSLILYCLGFVFLSVSAFLTDREDIGIIGLIAGLICVGSGRGGMESNMPPFLADQFSDITEENLGTLFRVFFWSINLGSFFGILLAPLMHVWVDYWLSFLVPSIVLFISFGVFLYERNSFNDQLPKENIVVKCIKIIYSAIHNKISYKSSQDSLAIQPKYWLDWAKPDHDPELVDGLRDAFKTAAVFSPFPIYWALFFQTNNIWVSQASETDLSTAFGVQISPDQAQLIRPSAILFAIPIINVLIFPCLQKMKFKLRPISRISIGFVMGIGATVAALCLQVAINNSTPQNKVSVFGQIPQYALLGLSEVFVSSTALELAYSEAPQSMKTVVVSLYTITYAFGNIIILIIAQFLNKLNHVIIFGVFGGVLTIFTLGFYLILRKFKYKKDSQAPELYLSHTWENMGLVFYGSGSESEYEQSKEEAE